MDAAGEKILFVVDQQQRLLGTVTDGDIRRWILKKRNMNGSVGNAMNKSPLSLPEGYSKDSARDLMIFKRIDCLPIVSVAGKVVSAIWWVDLFENKAKHARKIGAPVVIMAGGQGQRLSPFTKILPKPLLPIGEKPIAEVIINRFMEYGCKDFYLSVNYKSNLIQAYFADCDKKYNIKYIKEDKPLGTIGSLSLLRKKIKKTFFVSNCDVLIEADYADIFKFHQKKKNLVTLVCSMKHYTVPYGICQIENGGSLKSIQEKPEYDFLINAGIYVMEPEVLADIPLDKPYQITDLINSYLEKQKKVGVYPVSDKAWLDIGQFEQYRDTAERLEGW